MLLSIGMFWLGLAGAAPEPVAAPVSEPTPLMCAAANHGIGMEPGDQHPELDGWDNLFKAEHWQGMFVRSNPTDDQINDYWIAAGDLASRPEERRSLRRACWAVTERTGVIVLPPAPEGLDCIHFNSAAKEQLSAALDAAQADRSRRPEACSAVKTVIARHLEAMSKLERGELSCGPASQGWRYNAEAVLKWRPIQAAMCS